MPMSPRLLRPLASNRFLLDQFGGAEAAYSLRRLRAGYTGAAVRVRRSNDNAEENFTPEQVSSGSLTTWTGANSGFVVTWFDQSGNGRDATQGTANSQPMIVNSGSLVTESGRPAIDFSSTNQRLFFAGAAISSRSNLSQVAVCKVRDSIALKFLATAGASSTNSGAGLSFTSAEAPDLFIWGSANATGSAGFLSYALLSSVINGTSLSLFVNDNSAVTATAASALAITTNNFAIACQPNGTAGSLFNGTIQEVVYYFSNQTAAIINIRNAVNAHYKVF